ncbi:hypothetical protein T492DRAFT_1126108 [Pavlovales sp. CCMP2436]|nr:hypothetical protein T492DRAFT_1126108 [Pavlovales sp. CCMP2436]
MDVREKSSHIVSGSLFGLPHHGENVVLVLNGQDDQIVERDGAFSFSLKVNHLDPFNVSIGRQAWFGECSVTNGVGIAKDDVHDVIVYCGGARAGGQGNGSTAGAVFAGLFAPFFLLSACFAATGLAIGRRNGGGAREGFNILLQGARDLPRTLPSVQVPSFSGGGSYAPNQYFAGSGNEYAACNHMADAIPEALIVDAATGQPVVRASVVQ